MERVMSVEEKIKRAEEIYERRKQGNSRQVATVNITQKKDVKLLKKLLVQVLICSLIYTIIYTISKNDYPFSKDFKNKTNEILSYDTNFGEIYENVKNVVIGWFKNNENTENNANNESTLENSIGGAEEKTEQNNNEQIKEEENINANQNSNEQQNSTDGIQGSTQPLSQTEQDILNIKNTTTFIKPVEGVISSKYGLRPNATGTVPKNHTGTDIAANLGTKIISATDGEVVLASSEGDYRKTFKNTNR